MANWFQRMFTLPRKRNSIDEILGADAAATIKGMARAAIEEALTQQIGKHEKIVVAKTDEAIRHTGKFLVRAGVPSLVVAIIEAEMLTQTHAVVGKSGADAVRILADAAVRALKL